MQDVTTDLLIVGGGPAGLSLACFLSEYGEFVIWRGVYLRL
jgi:2-polyprenyl-6-methoxyphenol hydroxylase-like FAD-dependent oxidoreductase